MKVYIHIGIEGDLMEKRKVFFRNFVWNSMGSFIYLFCQWVLTVIVLRLSSDFENSGNLALAISVTNIFYTVAVFNVRSYLVSDMKNKYNSGDYIFFRISTCILSLILCFIYASIFQYSTIQLVCIMLYMLFKIGEALVDIMHAFEQRESRMDIGGQSLLIRGILTVTSFTLGLLIFDSLPLSIICMVIINSTFILLFDYRKVLEFVKFSPNVNWSMFKVMFFEFYPLAISQFLFSFALIYPRQVLEGMEGTEALGIFATVATPTVIIQVAATYIFNPLMTLFSEQIHEGRIHDFYKLIQRVTIIILVLSIVAVIGSFFFGNFALTLLFGNKIIGYSYLLIPIIIATSLNAYAWFLASLLVVCRQLKRLSLISIIGFALVLIASPFFVSTYSMPGVSYVLIIESCLVISLMIINLVRFTKKVT